MPPAPRQIIRFSADEFLILGLSFFFCEDITASTCRKTNLERFRKQYGCSPTVCNKIWADLQTEQIETEPIPKYLLMALNYLKVYPKDSNLAGPFFVTEKTALLQAKAYVKKISALKEMKIRWDFDANTEEIYIISVDGVHCRIYEPRTEPSAGWYSKKFNKAGLSYELGIAIYKNQLCWINGPFPAGQNDLGIFKKPNGLRSKIPLGKLVVADQGYVDQEIDHMVRTRNAFDSKEVKKFKGRSKARHETFNGRIKSFEILEQRFRSKGPRRMELHKNAFVACCVVVQYGMENGSPLFEV